MEAFRPLRQAKCRNAHHWLIPGMVSAMTTLVGYFSQAVTACYAEEPIHSPPHTMTEDPMARAGNPLCVAPWALGVPPWARCFPDSNYKGYYVGGGAALYRHDATAFRGEGRYAHEGTFGVDYAPWYSRVQTRWFHGRKHQGGEGQYEPDGRNNPLDNHPGTGRFR